MIQSEEDEGLHTSAPQLIQTEETREIIHETPNFVLITTFDSNTLHLNLQFFNHEDQSVSFFELSLTNDSLPESVVYVFDTIASLWDICFSKKENYTIQGNGRLRIEYNIHLSSDLRQREIFLNMLSVQRTETDMLRVYCRKVKEDLDRKNEEINRMKNKFEAYTIMKNNYSHLFTLNWDVVHHKNTSYQPTMLCFSTAIADAEKFDFSVTTIKKSYYYWVGVTTESYVGRRNSIGTSSICCFNVGQLYKNGSKSKSFLLNPVLDPQSTSDCVRMAVDRRSNKVSFHLDNGKGQTATETTDLGNLPGQQKLIPFIEFQSIGEYLVRINLA